MGTALDWAKDAWWDPSQKCVIMHANEEMVSMLQTDKDFIFVNKQVIVNVPSRALAKKAAIQSNNDLLLTGKKLVFLVLSL